TGPAAAAIAPPTELITAPRPPAAATAGARALTRPATPEMTGRSAARKLPTAATTTPTTPAMPARAAARPGFACTHWLIASTTCWMYGATVGIAETRTPPMTGATAESAPMSDSTTGPSASIAAPSTGPRTEARVPAKEATDPKADASAGIDGR